MGQTVSLCGSRSRLTRSPSLSFNEQPDALPSFFSHHSHSGLLKEERKDDDECSPSDSSYGSQHQQQQQQQRVVERLEDSDDEEDRAALQQRVYATKLRRDKTCAQLSAFSSSSSLHSSPGSGSDHAYYTTDEESPLSSASSSSSLSVQSSPPRVFTAATLQHHSSSHSITVAQHPHPLINSHPFTQHRIDVTPAQSQSELYSQSQHQHRTLTTSASTSCLHRASYFIESSSSSEDETLPHSRSYQHLRSATWQQQQPRDSQAGQIARSTATHSYSSSSLGLFITRPSSASSASSSPDSAPPTASFPSSTSSSTLSQDSRPAVTHNAVISIRPNVSSISLNTARTFRTHRRPIALESPTPSPVRHSDVEEDDSPMPTSSRSLFRATATAGSSSTCSSGNSLTVVRSNGLLLDCQPVSPGSYPGTCLSILRSQRVATM